MAERTASTALPNAATTLSPAVLKIRPARQDTGVAVSKIKGPAGTAGHGRRGAPEPIPIGSRLVREGG